MFFVVPLVNVQMPPMGSIRPISRLLKKAQIAVVPGPERSEGTRNL